MLHSTRDVLVVSRSWTHRICAPSNSCNCSRSSCGVAIKNEPELRNLCHAPSLTSGVHDSNLLASGRSRTRADEGEAEGLCGNLWRAVFSRLDTLSGGPDPS